jgi:hypothetical protein
MRRGAPRASERAASLAAAAAAGGLGGVWRWATGRGAGGWSFAAIGRRRFEASPARRRLEMLNGFNSLPTAPQ